jgi:dienelactone hydrolase
MKLIYKLMIPVVAAAALVTGSIAAVGAGRPAPTSPVVVQDVRIPVPGQAAVTAYLVRPEHPGRNAAGILYLHWFAPPAATQNRTEFLSEAIDAAGHGAVAVLPQLTFPWTADPVGDRRDRDAVEAQFGAVTQAYRYLLSRPGVNAHRTAVVGHDYGAMYGALLAERAPTVRAAVLATPDATWANWFDTYWLGLPADQKASYQKIFHGIDPVDDVSRLGSGLYLQFAGDDEFVPAATRSAFTAAAPSAKVSLYPDDDHSLDQQAKDDREAFLDAELGL